MPGANSEDETFEPSPDSLQISLLESDRVVTGMAGSKPLRMRTVGPGKKSGSVSFDAKHACTMTLYRPDGPQGAGYYVRSAEITYPDSVLTRADGNTSLLTARIRLQDVPDPSRINAQLRCRLPAVDGAKQRVRRFFRFGPEQLAAAGFTDPDSTAGQEYRRAFPQSRTGPNRKALDCDDVRVCWKGDCRVNDGGTSCFGGEEDGGDLGPGGLPGRGEGSGGCASGCDIPEFYPRDVSGGPTGSPGTRRPTSLGNDIVEADTSDFDCDNPNGQIQAAFCASESPTGTALRKTREALNQIDSRGGKCSSLAELGRRLLRTGKLRYFDQPVAPDFGGIGSELPPISVPG